MTESRHFIASGLIGFGNDRIRVRLITDFGNGRDVLVMTASLLDSGTPLLLDWSQLTPIEETVVDGLVHREGFVIFGGEA